MTTTTDEQTEQLVALRKQHAATVVAIEEAERELAPAERALTQAQAVYNEAAAGVAREMVAMAPPEPSATWQERSSREEAASEDTLRSARGVFEQAEEELGRRLVAYNAANQRRGDLVMHQRALEARIEQAEAELKRARGAATPDRDLLAGIRGRLGLGPSTPAA